MAAVLAESDLPPLAAGTAFSLEEATLECAREPDILLWESAVAGGCPAPQVALANALGPEQTLSVFKELGLYTAPAIHLPTDSLPEPGAFSDPLKAFAGQAEASASPLQLALAAATLSAGGVRPAPQLALAANTPASGWVVLPALSQPVQVFPPEAANQVAEALAVDRLPVWQSLGSAPNGPDEPAAWYLGGTLPSWNGAPLTLAILLEEGNPELAEVIGQAMLSAALQPE
jgi:hypothetical protein